MSELYSKWDHGGGGIKKLLGGKTLIRLCAEKSSPSKFMTGCLRPMQLMCTSSQRGNKAINI